MASGNRKVTGMVISAMPIGEYDTRIVLLTKEIGKVSVFARGARRPKSSFIAGCRPFSFGEFEIYEGRNSNTLSEVHIQNYFSEISSDIDATYYGFYFLELADYYAREYMDAREMLKLLYQTLRALLNENIPNRLVRVIYELKMLVYNGEYPQVFECVNCGSQNNNIYYSVSKCGVICEECRITAVDSMKIDVSTLYTMQYIITSSIQKLYTFQVSENVQLEIEKIMKRHFARHIDKTFKSLEILNTLEYNIED